ncbi:hypothetical protein [Leminorella grimontii]|uniref:hypothetical protein n=1 Tax=Leminorella grimontii TaxID=82981 RepID=UPI0021C49738|nr:hypothetical protein [Leminorella grimontii]
MEQSLKLANNFSLNDINFSGFSASESWAGYFEINKGFSFSLIEEAISLFEGFFKEKDEKIMVLTALSFDDRKEDDEETIRKYHSLYEQMKGKRLLLPMTEPYEDYLYGDSVLPADSLSISFIKNDFVEMSKLMMCHAGVIGEVCFYINPLLNIAVYPHDDVGFGCIGLNSEKSSCQEFLHYCSKSKNFNVFINNGEGLIKI